MLLEAHPEAINHPGEYKSGKFAKGTTPLMVTCKTGAHQISSILITGVPTQTSEGAKLLKADITKADDNGDTALCYAARFGHLKVLRTVLKAVEARKGFAARA